MSDVPAEGTVERWCFDYIAAEAIDTKLVPPPIPDAWEPDPPPRRIARPGRPPTFVLAKKAAKSPGPEAIRSKAKRAQLAHAFFHHELQAAELMAWAVLAFPDSPRAFRRGLLGIALDEVRHMRAYRDYLEGLGFAIGAFPVRDWFWERVPSATSPAHFVAVMGIGFEGGNLDHSARFADRLRAIGDDVGAALQARIAEEEVPHVRFAMHWFEHFVRATSASEPAPESDAKNAARVRSVDFTTWARYLPPPLSPLVMRGEPMNREARKRSGFGADFLEDLERWVACARGS
jgi:uncharacterized ferritin-like protein (DUF455 family)